MAIGISSTTNASAAGFGLEAQRAALAARRKEALEVREESPGDFALRTEREDAVPVPRVTETGDTRELRQDRVRLSQITDASQRPGIAAYLGVERATPADPSEGELLGIDIYV